MSAGRVMDRADRKIAGIRGALCLALEKRKPIPRADIQDWVVKLKSAAEELEALLKNP